MNKKANSIGQLLIFITLILVTTIVSAVLIESVSKTQSKANEISSRSTSKILNNMEILEISVKDTESSKINSSSIFEIKARLGIGSDDIKIKDILIEINNENNIQTLNYDSLNYDYENFNVSYYFNSKSALKNGYITDGELFSISIKNKNDILINDEVTFKFFNNDGILSNVKFRIPNILNKREILYPN